jgi:hypothetical protein
VIAEAEHIQLHSLSSAPSCAPTAPLIQSLPCTHPADPHHCAPNSTHNAGRGTSDLTGQMQPGRISALCPPVSSSLPALRIATLMTSDNNTRPTTANGTKCSSSSSRSSSSSSSSSLSVRELLLSARGKGWNNGMVLPCVTGVVVYKGLLSEGTEKVKESIQQGYKSFCQLQRDDYWQNNWFARPTALRKCKVVLRDVLYADIVTIYVPVSLAGCAVVGMHVALLNCTVHLTSSKGQLYLKESKGTQIGTALHTLLHCIVLHAIAVLYSTALHYTALHCTTLHCTALHYTALHCITLRCGNSFDVSNLTTPGVLGVTSYPQLLVLGSRSLVAPRGSEPDLHPGQPALSSFTYPSNML